MSYKEKILKSISSEFCIHIEKQNNNILFRKGDLKYTCNESLWDSEPLFANIKYVCEKMKVIYENSRTEKLCNDIEKSMNYHKRFY